MLGTRIRQIRLGRGLSLHDVAVRAKISVATLSRIERDKQAIDLGIFLTLSKILKTPPKDLLGAETEGDAIDPLAAQIARLDSSERTKLWKDLSTAVRTSRAGRSHVRQLSFEVEELLAQLDFLREEIKAVQKRLPKR